MKKNLLRECWRIACEKIDRHPEKNFIHFAFVVHNNKIISTGINREHVPPIHYGYQKRSTNIGFMPKLHAEVDAYHKAKGLLKGEQFEMVNIRLNRQLDMRMSKPCPCCYELLKALNCKCFYYSSEVGFLREV